MDSWEWNKIAGAVLGTLIFVMVIRVASETLFETPELEKQAYKVEGVTEENTKGPTEAPVAEMAPDWGTVLPAADVAAGEKVHGRCLQCHDLTKGGPNKIGPNLWGVIDRPKGSHPGFSYSAAMKSKGGNWTYDDLFHFLKAPQAFVPGTKMSFAGLRSEQDRINLIAYLRTEADTPPAIPAPKPAAAAPTTAPAGETPAAEQPKP